MRFADRRQSKLGPVGFRPAVHCCAVLAVLLLGFAVTDSSVCAQESWEYSPYKIQVWVAPAAVAEANEQVVADIARAVADRAAAVIGAPWDLTASPAPATLRSKAAGDLGALTSDDLHEDDRKVLLGDKLFVISLGFGLGGYDLQTRELDCRTRMWGPVDRRRVAHREALASAAFSAIVSSFTPIARVENITDEDRAEKVIRARVRAGGLIYGDGSPAEIAPGAVLQPVVRQNDRVGEPKKDGIRTVPWTLLQVADRDRDMLSCKVYSGMRSPLSDRTGRRTDRVALVVRPLHDSTRLRLQTRGKPPQGLAGYEVFSKTPQQVGADEESGDEAPAERLGQTDWRGVIDVSLGESPLRVLYVKSGGQLLARLPVAPGYLEEVDATLADDTPRLRAEGFVVGLQSNVMDLVARREVLTTRIHMRIKEKKFDEAQKLIEEFRALETRDDLINLLDQRSGLSSPDRRVQAKIDKLFNDTRNLLGNYLDPKDADQLLAELNTARGGQVGSE